MNYLNLRIRCVAGLLFKEVSSGTFSSMLAQDFLVGSKEKQDCESTPGRKRKRGSGRQKAFRSPAVVPFLFSLT